MWTRSVKWLQEKISSIFYTHGLFCASHPVAIILFVILIFLVLCYPLTTLPLPGNPPLVHETKFGAHISPSAEDGATDKGDSPRWFQGEAAFYVQQIVVKAIVSPWHPKILIQTDAFRAPLSSAFDVIETINHFVIRNGSETLSFNDVCYRVSEPVSSRDKLRPLLPSYNCLIVSPVNFWTNNRQKFNDDDQIIKTIYNSYGQTLDAPPSVRDILFGLPQKDTGITRFYLRNRQRVISYAVTIVMKDYNPRFLSGLEEKLTELYPSSMNSTANRKVIHFYFKNINYFVEYTPLLVTYTVLFMYLYFSVSKIEMVKSKWGLALSAVVTVLSSLLISVSLCTLFGLTPSLNGSEIFPYLVVIIGLENVLVVTKSVVSTPMHLDVKLRVAQGLSKEGWYIFKNLMTELFILFVGFFTFVPAIQEFCAFGLVGLVSDFFIQMFFYTTVLSIDIRRMELSDLQRQSVQITLQEGLNHKGQKKDVTISAGTNMPLHLASSSLLTPPPSPTRPRSPVFASYEDMFFPEKIWKTPRRVRFMNYWARTRILQRGIMLFVMVWIMLIVFKTGLVEYVDSDLLDQENDNMAGVKVSHEEQNYHPDMQAKHEKDGHIAASPDNHRSEVDNHRSEPAMVLLQHDNLEPWKDLSYMHWPTLLGYYNVSLLGRYFSLLPSIHLSMVLNPEVAIKLRNEKEAQSVQEYDDFKETLKPDERVQPVKLPSPTPWVIKNFFRYPRTRKEQVITILLGIASAVLLSFLIVSLYRCMCSRNYAKWRSSWSKTRRSRFNWPYYKQIRESVPLLLQGHLQEVESLAIDGSLIVSACLGGQIRLWDMSNGDCLTAIHRNDAKPKLSRPASLADIDYAPPGERFHSRDMHSSVSSLPSSYSPHDTKSAHHSRHLSVDFHSVFPDLTGSIETDFGSMYSSRKSHSRQSSFGGITYPPASLNSPTVHTPASVNSPLSQSPLSPNSLYSSAPFSPSCTENPVDPLKGFNFSHVNGHYLEHSKNLQERLEYLQQRKERLASQESMDANDDVGVNGGRLRSWSHGNSPNTLQVDATQIEQEFQNKSAPPVWCLACQGSLIVGGCANGRIEFWEGLTGCLKFIYSESKTGVTALSFIGNKVVAARLNGVVDYLEVVILSDRAKPPTPTALQSQLYNRAQLRRVASIPRIGGDMKCWDDEINVKLIATTRPHQRPINVMKAIGGMVVTASQDHTLKVSRIEDTSCLFTLHGHKGPVSALYVDESQPLTAASGSEDCTVRLWNVSTGGCLHKLEGHKSTVTSLTCTSMYVVSTGLDDRLCIWERIKGHLLHWIQMEPGYCNSVSMLTNKLMVTGGQGCIYLWDVSKGRALRAIQLGDEDHSIFVRQVHVVNNTSVVCDYGSQLQVIHFPAVLEKVE